MTTAKTENGRLPKTKPKNDVRDLLMKGAIANRELNLEMAEQWRPLEEEAWAYLPE